MTLQCAHCGTAIEKFKPYGTDKVYGANRGPVPMAGDSMICVACGGVLIFENDLTLRQATPAERDDLMKHPLFRRMMRQNAVRRAKSQQ